MYPFIYLHISLSTYLDPHLSIYPSTYQATQRLCLHTCARVRFISTSVCISSRDGCGVRGFPCNPSMLLWSVETWLAAALACELELELGMMMSACASKQRAGLGLTDFRFSRLSVFDNSGAQFPIQRLWCSIQVPTVRCNPSGHGFRFGLNESQQLDVFRLGCPGHLKLVGRRRFSI